MRQFTKRVATLFMIAMVALSVLAGGFAGSAVALSSATATAGDGGTGATDVHTVTATSSTDVGDIQEIELDYADAADLSGLEETDATVTIDGTVEDTDGFVVDEETNTVTLTLATAYTLDDTVDENVEVELDGVVNPSNAGDYDITMDIIDDTGSSIDTATAALSVVVGDTPSVTSTSGLSEGAVVTNYAGDDATAETLEVEAYTSNLEATILTADGHELGTVSDVTTVSEADSSTDTPGTYEIDINHSEYRGLELAINDAGNATIEVSNLDADTPDNSFEHSIENGDTVSQMHIGADDNRGEFEDNSITVLDRTLWERSDASIEDTRDVSSNTSTIYVSNADENVSDEIDAAIPDDAESGDRLGMMMSSSLDDGITYVFYDEAGEKIDGSSVDAASDSYIVLNDDGSPHEINLSEDDVEDGGSVDVGLVANDAPSPSDLRDDLDYGFVDSLGVLTFGLPLVGAFLFFVGRPRIESED